MADYYRTSFTIEDAPELQGIALLEKVSGIVRDWAELRFGEPLGDNPTGSWESGNGSTLHIDGERFEESSFWGLVLEHPDRDEYGFKWRSDFRFATRGEQIEAEVEVRRIGDNNKTPASYGNANRPNALTTLFQEFNCTSGGESLTTKARRIVNDEVDTFVNDSIFNSDRLLPLMVVSENRLGGTFVSADHLQLRLLGLAIVATYNDQTSRNVTDALGNLRLGCWDGSIRVYRPRCSQEGAPWQNPYWTWQQMNYILRQSDMDWERLLMQMGDECLNLAIHQAGPRMYVEVSSQVRRLRYERLLERLRNAESSASGNDEYKELLDYADAVMHQNDELRKEKEELSEKNAELEAQLSEKDSVIEQLNISLLYEPEDEDEDADEVPPDFDSVYETVEYAKRMEGLRFFSYAVELAKGASYFPRPSDVYDVFNALNECAQARSKGSLGKHVHEWLAEKNIDYAPHESETTMGKFGSQRTFRDDVKGVRRTMPSHIKLGGGLGESRQLRIHLIWDEDENKWLIGYIGRHLRTAQSPN